MATSGRNPPSSNEFGSANMNSMKPTPTSALLAPASASSGTGLPLTELETSGKYVALTAEGGRGFDTELYGEAGPDSDKYLRTEVLCEGDDDAGELSVEPPRRLGSEASVTVTGYQANRFQAATIATKPADSGDDDVTDLESFASSKNSKAISAREGEYRQKRYNVILSPERADPFAPETPAPELRTFGDIMAEHEISKEKIAILRELRKRARDGVKPAPIATTASAASGTTGASSTKSTGAPAVAPVIGDVAATGIKSKRISVEDSEWDVGAATPHPSSDATPGLMTPMIPAGGLGGVQSYSWLDDDRTPAPPKAPLTAQQQPPAARKRNRWDSTPTGTVTASTGESDNGERTVGEPAGNSVVVVNKSRATAAVSDETPLVGETPAATPGGRWGSMTPLSVATSTTAASTTAEASGTLATGAIGGAVAAPKGLKKSRWDTGTTVTTGAAAAGQAGAIGATPTPLMMGTPMMGATPGATTLVSGGFLGMTPMGGTAMRAMETPITPAGLGALGGGLSGDQLLKLKIQSDIDMRNLPLTDEELNSIIPSEGYEIVEPPADYVVPLRSAISSTAAQSGGVPVTPGMTNLLGATGGVAGSLTALLGGSSEAIAAGAATTLLTPAGLTGAVTPGMAATPMFNIPDVVATSTAGTARLSGDAGQAQLAGPDFSASIIGQELGDVVVKQEDYQVFARFFDSEEDEQSLSHEEIQERKIAALLLKIKNGSPPVRRSALKQITDKAREFGPNALFNQILPLMMQSTLEDQERHLLVKVIDRVLYKLDDKVRPYVHKVLVVVEPLLIDEDYYARVEGREIISNLAKAAGLATMIATMRPDIDHQDEYVRNTTARAFAVVASALGIPALLLFLKAVCQSKKSWQARHTGTKIVQQIAILMGCAVLPHLKQLVDVVAAGLQDEQQKVRTITALAIGALAEAAAPYGIEAFDCVLRPLWKGITEHRGKGLAAFLKAIGMIIPLMDAHHANYYTREVMVILIREFSTPDEEMKKIILKVIRQCTVTEGVEASYVQGELLGPFFANFWIVRNALDRRNAKQVIETTVELGNKVGGNEVIRHVVGFLKDPSEPFRRMTLSTISQITESVGLTTLDQRLEELLIDGMMFAFQEQNMDEQTGLLNAFGTIMNALGVRCKPYLPQIAGTIRWRLNTPSSRNRQQAADLISRIALVMKNCDEDKMLGHLGLYLFEYLGEEYPEVLGSILGALKAIVNVVGMQKMTPPIKDLLPRLTPILKNRHEKVQENVIDLIGRIADRGGDLVSPKEWDRICFDLLELLKAHKKGIRRAAVNTFGYIARAIGPADVLLTLLTNLRVQERQLRVCTTVAIAIVAETCLPYTVLPALLNEYKTPDLNVRNGVLKSLSFMFEYIGEMGRDYVDTVAPLLEDALMDRDLVHRQTAAWAVKHLALGVQCLGCEDALLHLLNYVWPNIFETSPHLMQAVFDAIDGFRVSLGPCILLQYLLQGLFHPARKVRECYWRMYNNVYIGHQDALIPYFPEISLPRIPAVPATKSEFRREELFLVV